MNFFILDDSDLRVVSKVNRDSKFASVFFLFFILSLYSQFCLRAFLSDISFFQTIYLLAFYPLSS